MRSSGNLGVQSAVEYSDRVHQRVLGGDFCALALGHRALSAAAIGGPKKYI
jgi:phosphopantetheine adenylyltransferase